ncbi:MAG: hypothetical protein HWE39_22760 [Oceanospirillaceae bacterium]|nr:hypothetical protein [Oceanospirillaceae bacterium]
MELKGVTPVTELGGFGGRPRTTAYRDGLYDQVAQGPRAALVFPDQSIYKIDFERGNVKLSDGRMLLGQDQLEQRFRRLYERRLHLPGEG